MTKAGAFDLNFSIFLFNCTFSSIGSFTSPGIGTGNASLSSVLPRELRGEIEQELIETAKEVEAYSFLLNQI
jgi:hypothetical protein